MSSHSSKCFTHPAYAEKTSDVKTLRDVMAAVRGRFVVDTVVGPYVCEWRLVDDLPAVVFIIPKRDDSAAPVAVKPPAPAPAGGAVAKP